MKIYLLQVKTFKKPRKMLKDYTYSEYRNLIKNEQVEDEIFLKKKRVEDEICVYI